MGSSKYRCKVDFCLLGFELLLDIDALIQFMNDSIYSYFKATLKCQINGGVPIIRGAGQTSKI